MNRLTQFVSRCKIAFVALFFIVLASCQKHSLEVEPTPEAPLVPTKTETIVRPSFDISLAEVSLGECMSLAALLGRLQDPLFDYPAAAMTNHLEFLSKEVAPKNAKFIAYSTFYYKSALAKDLIPFSKVIQADCKMVQLVTASGQQLKYNIVESSDRHLKFELINEFDDVVPIYQKETLFKRFQPTEYDIQIISNTEIKIVKKMRLFDPLCKNKKNGFDVMVTDSLAWANSDIELPLSYPIEKEFMALVLSSLKTPPVAELDKPLAVLSIKEIMSAPVLDEIKLCN